MERCHDMDWLRRSSIVAVAVVVVLSACGDSTQSSEPPATQTQESTQPEPTSGPGGDATRVLEELGRDGFRLAESGAAVELDAPQALRALAKHYDLSAITPQAPEVILAEVVRARSRSSFTRGQQVYVIYATGFEQIEYGPLPESGTPQEIIVTQVAFFLDANTGDFIVATWWE